MKIPITLQKIYISSLLSFTFIFTTLDLVTNPNIKTAFTQLSTSKILEYTILLLLHNAVYFSIYFTIFFLIFFKNMIDKDTILIYLIYLVAVVLHWRSNNDKCRLTQIKNDIINIPTDTGFRDPYTIIMGIYNPGGDLRSLLYNSFMYGAISISAYMYLTK